MGKPNSSKRSILLTHSEASADREVMDDATLLLPHAQLDFQA
jgi:hypothetical protein